MGIGNVTNNQARLLQYKAFKNPYRGKRVLVIGDSTIIIGALEMGKMLPHLPWLMSFIITYLLYKQLNEVIFFQVKWHLNCLMDGLVNKSIRSKWSIMYVQTNERAPQHLSLYKAMWQPTNQEIG